MVDEIQPIRWLGSDFGDVGADLVGNDKRWDQLAGSMKRGIGRARAE